MLNEGIGLSAALMKRFAAALAGLVFGLLLTWACLYSLSHAHLPRIGLRLNRSGCDVEHCGPEWVLPAIAAFFLLPSMGFAVAGFRSVSRAWSLRKTAVVFGWLSVGTVLGFTVLYVL